MPSKRTKCILRQPNFQNFPGKHATALRVIARMDIPKYGETLRDTYPLEASASGARLVLLDTRWIAPSRKKSCLRACS